MIRINKDDLKEMVLNEGIGADIRKAVEKMLVPLKVDINVAQDKLDDKEFMKVYNAYNNIQRAVSEYIKIWKSVVKK